jgi:uncharacterized protein YkwD
METVTYWNEARPRHAAVLLLLLLALILPASTKVLAQSLPDIAAIDSYSSYLFKLVNEDRQKNGSDQLQKNRKLDTLAQSYADYMLRSGFFGHVDPFGRSPQDRARLFGINGGVSENLAWESSNFENAAILIRRAEDSMMKEPAGQLNHRYNILDPDSKYIGIGVARAGDRVMIVQEFSRDEP